MTVIFCYLFVNLSEVDDFLNRPERDEPEDGHIPALADAIRSAGDTRVRRLLTHQYSADSAEVWTRYMTWSRVRLQSHVCSLQTRINIYFKSKYT